MPIENFNKYAREPIGFVKMPWGEDLGIFKQVTTIGSDSTNDIVLNRATASRKHGKIFYDINQHHFIYQDFSETGTYINGHLIHNNSIPLEDAPARIMIIRGEPHIIMTFEPSFAELIDQSGHSHIISTNKEFVLGRKGTIILPEIAKNKKISKEHATIRFHPEDMHYEFEDHSLNGAIINGKNVSKQKVILKDGDSITLGNISEGYTLKFMHFVPVNINNIKSKVIEPKSFEEADWQKIITNLHNRKGVWAGNDGKPSNQYSSWKFHIYADNDEDLFAIGTSIIPILLLNKIKFKTVNSIEGCNRLNANNLQRGKAFTIYISLQKYSELLAIKSEAKKILRIIEPILNRPGLKAKRQYHLSGDKHVPIDTSGRVFYRYDGDIPISSLGGYKGYRNNSDSIGYNIPGNPDIF